MYTGNRGQHQLEVAADAILQLATIVEAKYIGVIEEVKARLRSSASRDPIVPINFFGHALRVPKATLSAAVDGGKFRAVYRAD
ncbi:hypothetical protein ACQ4M3_00340 [Leptolyngbya sp. AN03gr2]|uniref:hypothetical protein n=1 Tax=unclassified Leptolyngbya TaxID=2650499 RepID=UPI003D311887